MGRCACSTTTPTTSRLGRRWTNETVTATLPDGLADGTYTVVFEIISVDSHRIGGASVFHVGAPSSEGLTGDALDLGGDEAGWGVRAGATVLSAIAYTGALVAAGTLFFSMYADRRAELRAVTSRAAVLGAVALVAAVPFRVARLGGGLDALRDNDVLMSALRGPVGVSTAVTANALLVVAVLVDRRAPRWIALLFALVALAGFSIEGHTRATERRWAMVASDVVHLGGRRRSGWAGSSPSSSPSVRRATPARSPPIVRRFSDSALVAVGVVAVTGVAMAWIILPTVGELTSTGYGLALIVKVALVARRHRPRGVQPVSPGARRRRTRAGAGRPPAESSAARRWLGKVVARRARRCSSSPSVSPR